MADHPDEIRVTEIDGKRASGSRNAGATRRDMGRLIGKNGRTINAIRTLLETLACEAKAEGYAGGR